LATRSYTLRQIPNRLSLRNSSRSNRYLLVMSPDPSMSHFPKGAIGHITNTKITGTCLCGAV
jgi:hypothetical protein